MVDETSEMTGTDEVSSDSSGKVADEAGKDVGETGVGKGAGDVSGEVSEGNKKTGELEEGGEAGDEEAGVTGELCKKV